MLSVSNILSLLNQCLDLSLTRSLHCYLIKLSLTSHTLLSNRLIHLYSLQSDSPLYSLHCFHDLPFKNSHSYNILLNSLLKYSSTHLNHALNLFDEMPRDSRDLVTYNTVISSLTRLGKYQDSLIIFAKMVKDRNLGEYVVIDRFTVIGVVSACANLHLLKILKQLHGCILVSGLELDLIVCNAIIDAYGKNRDVESAQKMFDKMPIKDSVSWSSLITAYSWVNRLEDALKVFEMNPVHDSGTWTAIISAHEQNCKEDTALNLFEKMLKEKVEPNSFTLVSVLGACAKLGLVKRGKEIHSFITRRCIGFNPFNIFIHNALMDMYSKCGDMDSALKVFDKMPERDSISWNSILTGYSHNGQGKKSLAVFENMIKFKVKPNYVTFLGLLTACSHAGLVSEAKKILNRMESVYSIKPKPEHYSAFIDALVRNQQFLEAIEFIKKENILPISTFNALFGTCQVHGNLEIVERVVRSLIELKTNNSARYVMLSNIYAMAGKFDESRKIRSQMKIKGLKKEIGCSWIEVRGLKYEFIAHDRFHNETKEIYEMLGFLFDDMRSIGNFTDEYLLLNG